MKPLISILLICLTHPVLAESTPPIMKHWVDENKKLVYFLPTPVLKIKWTHFGINREFWDQVIVDYSYLPIKEMFEKQGNELKAKYPDYLYARVMMMGSESVHLKIPALEIDEDVQIPLSVDGPYLYKTFFIPKEESALVKKAIQEKNFAIVTGKVQFYAPGPKTVESHTFKPTICDELLKNGNTLYSVMNEFSKFERKLDSLQLKYESTKEMLKHSLLKECIEMPNTLVAESFMDLLNAQVKKRADASDIYGETKKIVNSIQSEPFEYITTVEVTP